MTELPSDAYADAPAGTPYAERSEVADVWCTHGVRWTHAGGRLPLPLAALDSTVAWALEAIAFDSIGDGAALYSGVFTTPTANPSWSAVESWVVVRTDAGWRVRYLHRSRGQEEAAPLP